MKAITLQGSVQVVVEYFEYAINSILYQRELYPSEDFRMVKKYGLCLMKTNEENLHSYLSRILSQLENWILAKKICKLVMVISAKHDPGKVLERWQFDIVLQDKENIVVAKDASKSLQQVNLEIAGIIRQITASVSFLPIHEPDSCTFNILAYTDKDADVPIEWIDSDARLVDKNAELVKLRSFSTNAYKVDTLVTYRVQQSDDV